MGTYYTVGVIKYFSIKTAAYSEISVPGDYLEILDRNLLDVSLYDTRMENEYLIGELKKEIFKENIKDLYQKLKKITGVPNIDYYFESHGENIEEYPDWPITIKIQSKKLEFLIEARYILLFIEGKVFAESFGFNIEPRLINWLFRHSSIDNKLKGCMISDITGISSNLLPRFNTLIIREI